MSRKFKAVLIYGGRSTEHEVSRRSAAYIWKNIDRKRFEAHAIAVDKQGQWHPQNSRHLSLSMPDEMPMGPANEADPSTIAISQAMWTAGAQNNDLVVFNIIHGTSGEDGALQGFLEFQEIAHVGSSILGAAVAMDKVVAKQLVATAGLAIVPYLAFRMQEWQEQRNQWGDRILAKLSFPMFVKPSSLGSSVGIRRVHDRIELEKAIDFAFEFDERVLIETGIDAREIEYACLGDYAPQISAPGEIGVPSGFYSYEEKYSNYSKAEVIVPASLPQALIDQGHVFAQRIFYALNLFGLARIDLFLSKHDQKFLFNEANTLPGMTAISQYPKLWEHEGIHSMDLISKLLDSAIARRAMQNRLKRSL